MDPGPTSVQDPVVVSDFLDSFVSELEYFGAERLNVGPITLESTVKERLRHSATVVADERAEVAPTVSRQRKLEAIQPPYGIDAFMPSAVTVHHYRLRMKAGDHLVEIVLVERVEVASDDLFFSSSHVPFLPRAVWSRSSMKARALALTILASWWITWKCR